MVQKRVRASLSFPDYLHLLRGSVTISTDIQESRLAGSAIMQRKIGVSSE